MKCIKCNYNLDSSENKRVDDDRMHLVICEKCERWHFLLGTTRESVKEYCDGMYREIIGLIVISGLAFFYFRENGLPPTYELKKFIFVIGGLMYAPIKTMFTVSNIHKLKTASWQAGSNRS